MHVSDDDMLLLTLEEDLYRAGWDGARSPYPGITVRQMKLQQSYNSFLKKLEPEETTLQDAAALELFLECNEKCKGTFPEESKLWEIEAIALGETKNFVYDFFYPRDQTDAESVLTWSSIRSGFGFGSGANIGSYETDFMSKLGSSDMASADPLLHRIFGEYVRTQPVWAQVEHMRHAMRGTAVVRGSRLSFVPKTSKISRTICTEPVLNMLFQKGIQRVLESRLKQVCCIDLSTQQTKNRELARIGSQTGRFGTIDLSSASDTISLSFVRWALPRDVLNILLRTACRYTILPDGREIELHMISSMGNAFTFPLQTILFTAIVYGVYRALGIKFLRPYKHNLGNFAVNGDDIIVVSEAYDLVCRVINRCGFKVNVDKSFNIGTFRESCGLDFYQGQNVRGVYIKSLSNDHDRYSAINRLNRWSALHGILLCNTIEELQKRLPKLLVPLSESDDSGVKVPYRSLKTRRFDRWHRVQYRCLVREPRTFDVSKGIRPAKAYKGSELLAKNPDVVCLAAVAGMLRLGRVALRSKRDLTKVRRRYCSSWDYTPPEHRFHGAAEERWKSFFELNLNLF